MNDRTQYLVTDSYAKGQYGVAAIGVASARIVARQTFKAWRCSFNEGVTWSAPSSVPEPVADEAVV